MTGSRCKPFRNPQSDDPAPPTHSLVPLCPRNQSNDPAPPTHSVWYPCAQETSQTTLPHPLTLSGTHVPKKPVKWPSPTHSLSGTLVPKKPNNPAPPTHSNWYPCAQETSQMTQPHPLTLWYPCAQETKQPSPTHSLQLVPLCPRNQSNDPAPTHTLYVVSLYPKKPQGSSPPTPVQTGVSTHHRKFFFPNTIIGCPPPSPPPSIFFFFLGGGGGGGRCIKVSPPFWHFQIWRAASLLYVSKPLPLGPSSGQEDLHLEAPWLCFTYQWRNKRRFHFFHQKVVPVDILGTETHNSYSHTTKLSSLVRTQVLWHRRPRPFQSHSSSPTDKCEGEKKTEKRKR